MAIPVGKQAAGERGTDAHAPLRHETTWHDGAAQAAEARHAVRALLADASRTGRAAPPPSLAMDAELAVSELVTNAVLHAPGPCGLILRLSGDELTITVWDTSTAGPTVRGVDPSRIGGHGLRLVHTVSDGVVVTPHAGGKRITAHFSLTPAPGADRPDRTVPADSSATERDGTHGRSAALDGAKY
ncbi:ATP-binding protein [Streptomyces sp. NPDC012825]|uniref:ATP-binding protein n=1 Tax=Streptomyces sp. NPDC012825 TaxID=3364851 RepID=UPI0036CBFCAA